MNRCIGVSLDMCVREVLQGILCLETKWEGKETLPLSALLDSNTVPLLSHLG